MSINQSRLVTAILPAYNAAATLHETLVSVREQTHAELEIIVVDDGSTDETRRIAERHAADDARVRVLSQANGGVANARNAGLAAASGAFVAPIDADDLWRPDKIARQFELMSQRGPNTNLVYTWFALIDGESRVRRVSKPCEEGRVLAPLCLSNFVGHASSPLMRTRSVLDAGGYDPSLRTQAAQGCEDWQLYLKLAEAGEFAVVKSPLTGYRITDQSMSSNIGQMMRSYRLVMDQFQAAHPEYSRELRSGLRGVAKYLVRRSFEAGKYKPLYTEFLTMAIRDPLLALNVSSHFTRRLLSSKAMGASRNGDRRTSPIANPPFLGAYFEDNGTINPAAG